MRNCFHLELYRAEGRACISRHIPRCSPKADKCVSHGKQNSVITPGAKVKLCIEPNGKSCISTNIEYYTCKNKHISGPFTCLPVLLIHYNRACLFAVPMPDMNCKKVKNEWKCMPIIDEEVKVCIKCIKTHTVHVDSANCAQAMRAHDG